MYRARLQWQPIAVLLIIAMIWGSNMAFVKLGLDSKDRVIFNGSEIKDLTILVQKCLALFRNAWLDLVMLNPC